MGVSDRPPRPGRDHLRAKGARVEGLRIELASGAPIVEGLDLVLKPGEILGLVGESGSGKTTTALALLGYSTPGAVIACGRIDLGGVRMQIGDELRSVRGSSISYVPQNPGRSLNPSLRIGAAISDLLDSHRIPGDRRGQVIQALEDVGLPGTREFARRFPHQLSGGQQQRVCIAAALVCRPAIVVLDEPTTGLDVSTQSRILDQLRLLRTEHQTSMVYVSHDLAVVSQLADRIAVMYAGEVVEEGTTASVLARPRHPYTRGLLASIPDHVHPRRLEPLPGIAMGVGERTLGCQFAPRCSLAHEDCETSSPALREVGDGHNVRCTYWESVGPPVNAPLVSRERTVDGQPILEIVSLSAQHGRGSSAVVAADDITFSVGRGECVALVGESGSGKTTIARVVSGLHTMSAGSIKLDGREVFGPARRRSAEQRRRLQIIFQNPSEALNPRRSVGDEIARSARSLRGLDRRSAAAEVDQLLERVRLPARLRDHYPAQLSGGERQRVSIARALAARPDVILCDEITSALDVSVQAAILEVLGELRQDLGLALLFITHDLGVVATVADRVLVLEMGRICEEGSALEVLGNPGAAYTQALLAAAPSLNLGTEVSGPKKSDAMG